MQNAAPHAAAGVTTNMTILRCVSDSDKLTEKALSAAGGQDVSHHMKQITKSSQSVFKVTNAGK